jgi:hypothetical protein
VFVTYGVESSMLLTMTAVVLAAPTMTPEQRQEVRAKMMGLQSTIQSKQQTTPAKPAQ